jgi:hypothetical protein
MSEISVCGNVPLLKADIPLTYSILYYKTINVIWTKAEFYFELYQIIKNINSYKLHDLI